MAAGRAGSLRARGLKPAAEYGRHRPHGDRLRYMAGCRCQACRAANTDYEKMRARARREGRANGIVPAAPTRRHLKRLSAAGIGYKRVANRAGVSRTVLADVLAGRKVRIRAETERAVLGVKRSDHARHALVDAGPTWTRIDQLRAEGFTKKWIAEQIGQTRCLQVGRERVLARTAERIRVLWDRYMTVAGTPRPIGRRRCR